MIKFSFSIIVVMLFSIMLSCGKKPNNTAAEKCIKSDLVEKSEIKNALVDSLADGDVIVMSDLEMPTGGDFVIRLNNEPYSGKVFSEKSFDGRSVAFENINEGKDIVGFEVYYPNGQKAYECKGDLSYDGIYYSPDGTVIDFYEFATKYCEVWCRHEGYLPLTLICPACLLDQMEYEKNPDKFNPNNTHRAKLIRKYGGLDNI